MTLLELINNYSKVVGYKINIQNPITFLYTSNEQVEFEIKNVIPFILTFSQMNYTGITNTRTPIWRKLQNSAEINQRTKQCRDGPCSWIERLNVKMSVIPTVFCRFRAVPVKIPPSSSVDTDKLSLKLMWQAKTQKSQHKVGEEQSWGPTPSNFRSHHGATVIKTLWYWRRNRRREQWDSTERPETQPHTHCPRHKATRVFNKWGRNNGTSTRKKWFQTQTSRSWRFTHRGSQTQCRMRNDQTSRRQHRRNPGGPCRGGDFSHTAPKAQSEKERTGELDFVNTSTCVLWKTVSGEWEDKPQPGRKHLPTTPPIQDSDL